MRRFRRARMLQVRPPAGGSLRLAVAERPVLRLIGLAGLPALDPAQGLLIPRCASIHTLGMRFAIDVVFVQLDPAARSFVVLETHATVPPRRLVRSRCRIAATLELAAGETRRHGLGPGAAATLRACGTSMSGS